LANFRTGIAMQQQPKRHQQQQPETSPTAQQNSQEIAYSSSYNLYSAEEKNEIVCQTESPPEAALSDAAVEKQDGSSQDNNIDANVNRSSNAILHTHSTRGLDLPSTSLPNETNDEVSATCFPNDQPISSLEDDDPSKIKDRWSKARQYQSQN
jgi:hypothetical protein